MATWGAQFRFGPMTAYAKIELEGEISAVSFDNFIAP